MNRMTKWALYALTCAAMTACGSIPKQTFVFDVRTVDEQPQPSMIVVNNDWESATINKQFVHAEGKAELQLTIPFERGEVSVTVAPLVPGTTNPSSRKEAFNTAQLLETEDATRGLRLGDPRKQLFLLAPK